MTRMRMRVGDMMHLHLSIGISHGHRGRRSGYRRRISSHRLSIAGVGYRSCDMALVVVSMAMMCMMCMTGMLMLHTILRLLMNEVGHRTVRREGSRVRRM